MNKPPAKTIRLVAAMLVTAAVIGLSRLAIQAPTHNQNSLAHSLKSVQTDKATLFYAKGGPWDCRRFVEQVLPGTGESKAAIEDLRRVAATL